MAPRTKKTCFHSGKTFRELTPGERFRFVGKALVFCISGGFIFPTMWVD